MVSFLFIFGLCETSIQFLQQINVKKVHPVHPQPSEHESHAITTRPVVDIIK